MNDAAASLQNHLGDGEFPVRPRRRYAAWLDARRRNDPRERGRRAVVLTAIAAPFGVAGYVQSIVWWGTGVEPVTWVLCFAIGMFFGLAVGVIIMLIRDSRAPRRSQRDYLARSGARPLTVRQQQILVLDASSDFSSRGWNSSLAFAPTFAELPQDLRRKYNDGHDGSPWFALNVMPLQDFRAALDEQFKIASATDVEMLAADTLMGKPLSDRFAHAAGGELGDRMMSRVAALTGRPVFDLLELVHGTGDHPGRLLLAGDTERAIGGIRYAYVAGYITAAESWDLLEPVAAKAFAAYSGWDEYWEDVVVATAFRTDSLDAVQRQRDNLAELRASRWPAVTVPFPLAGDRAVL